MSSPQHKPLLSLSLRTKVWLVSLVVLAIPWVGYQYVHKMEGFLRQGQEHALLATAQAVATVLHEQPELFEPHGDLLRSVRHEDELYAPPLDNPIKLDGNTEDWKDHLGGARVYAAQQVLASYSEYRPESLSFRHVMGSYGRYLYTLFMVRDDHLVFRAANSLRLDQSDHLQIALQDPEGGFHRYLLSTPAPGWVNAHLMDESNPVPVRPEVRIKGEWRNTEDGYNLEIRIPLSMIGAKLAFAIGDVDDPETRAVEHVIGTAGTQRIEELGTVLVPSPEIEKLLKSLRHSTSRLWVVDRKRRVLALAGDLGAAARAPREEPRTTLANMLHGLHALILREPDYDFEDDPAEVTRLEGRELESALEGKPAIRWRPTRARDTAIVAAAHPVFAEGQVIGAVVAEQTSNTIMTLQNLAVEHLVDVTLVVFLVATVALLSFASRLSLRIRRLRDEAERAIGSDGRVCGQISDPRSADELGDLARSFSDLLARIGQYTRYLETMAGKLSHELRTPLAVVRSSLENLEMEDLRGEAGTYTRRAREGLDRLAGILASMSEAARLEHILQRADREDFDLREVVAGCVAGYAGVYPHKTFRLEASDDPVPMQGVPDLIAQMLDKLISNAVDFSEGDDPIIVRLGVDRGRATLAVLDAGARLPAQMIGRLFESMVSIRPPTAGEPHLGMGLYIVRLIAEFHHGTVAAAERGDVQGAEITATLPLGRPGSERGR
jgi:two-component system sensor histidine kinase ChvG